MPPREKKTASILGPWDAQGKLCCFHESLTLAHWWPLILLNSRSITSFFIQTRAMSPKKRGSQEPWIFLSWGQGFEMVSQFAHEETTPLPSQLAAKARCQGSQSLKAPLQPKSEGCSPKQPRKVGFFAKWHRSLASNRRNEAIHFHSKESISQKGQRNRNKTEPMCRLDDLEVHILGKGWQSLRACETVWVKGSPPASAPGMIVVWTLH